MEITDSTKRLSSGSALFLREDWFDPLEAGVRTRVRGFIEAILEAELDEALARRRYQRRLTEAPNRVEEASAGHRHGHRERELTGTFGPVKVRVPRARLETASGGTIEWKNAAIPAYKRREAGRSMGVVR
jgi:transposase-like protein